jgi:hypothetical protein
MSRSNNRIGDLSPTPIWSAQRASAIILPCLSILVLCPTPEDHARGFYWVELHNTCWLLLND